MRAKTVYENINFERGIDPKDSLEIGDKEAREFKKALRGKDYFAPVLANMINGLVKKTVSEKEAIRFVDGAIDKFDKSKNQKLLWYEWYQDSWNNAYWNTDHDKFIIKVEMPDNELFDMDQDRKVICEISPILSSEFGDMFKIRSFAKIKNEYENFYETPFYKENVFLPNDDAFTLLWACRSINYVVETVIKELG
jgi:hypothetical protein